MDGFVSDQSGINSLGGFAYQIKVFVAYMLSMDDSMQVGFETLEDVSVSKLTSEKLDENEDKFRNLILTTTGIRAVQVKRTSITREVAKQILLNWILLETKEKSVTEYVLFTDRAYNNQDIVFGISADDLFLEVMTADKSKKATISKVQKEYKDDKQAFLDTYNAVKNKYTFVSADVDNEIDEKSKVLFKKAGVNIVTYYSRIQELLKHITYEVLRCINEKKPYIISYDEMIAYAEDICIRFTDEYMYPAYSEFTKLNRIDFSDLQIARSREYRQLLACGMPQKLIETYLQYGCYYQNICYKYLELNKICKIKDIEQTTYDNFERVKFMLQCEGSDTPLRRLNETQKQPNSYADSDQIKYGSGIYLTREEEIERQISWEDEDNAKPRVGS